MKGYKYGKKRNEDVDIKEKRRIVLKDLREEEDIKEINRKKAWHNAWNQRWQPSPAQKRAGARKIL